MMHGQKNIK